MLFRLAQLSTTSGYKVTIGVLRIREQDRQGHGVSRAAYSAWVFLSAISLQTGEYLGGQKDRLGTSYNIALSLTKGKYERSDWYVVLEMVEGHQRLEDTRDGRDWEVGHTGVKAILMYTLLFNSNLHQRPGAGAHTHQMYNQL